MLHRISAVLVALLLASGAAFAGGGGKIKWREGRQHDQALAEARLEGRAVVLYFTGEG